MRAVVAIAMLGLAACSKESHGDVCLPGHEGCACSATPPTCDEELVCDIGTCVPPGATTEAGTDDAATGTTDGETTADDDGSGSGSGGGSLDCTGDCAPPNVGCEADEGCYPQPDGFICAPAGDAHPGDGCEFVNDCVAGAACFASDDSLTCTALCTDDVDCPDDLACMELTSATGCICG